MFGYLLAYVQVTELTCVLYGAIPEPSLAFWWRHVFFFWRLVTILPLCQSWPRPMAGILVIVSQTQFVVGSGLSVGLVCCGVLAVPWQSYLCPVCYMAPGCLQSVVLLILLPPPPYFPPFFCFYEECAYRIWNNGQIITFKMSKSLYQSSQHDRIICKWHQCLSGHRNWN